eukprot:scaffold16616_cov105-Phaeocystis_antarctica.AAC.2
MALAPSRSVRDAGPTAKVETPVSGSHQWEAKSFASSGVCNSPRPMVATSCSLAYKKNSASGGRSITQSPSIQTTTVPSGRFCTALRMVAILRTRRKGCSLTKRPLEPASACRFSKYFLSVALPGLATLRSQGSACNTHEGTEYKQRPSDNCSRRRAQAEP